MNSIFVLYVADQTRSKEFYKKALALDPMLDVPGMTEFELSDGCKLGLMPEKGIATILGNAVPDPASANGVPRCELYLNVDDPQACCDRAVHAGAKQVSALQLRGWGDEAAYVADPDGHIITFARTPGVKRIEKRIKFKIKL
ncbi:MAG TPA: VOC family protein [Candidatus Edwardsbacteria bacterium]|nr:VOC family protein [Candidatus Edwardsbacteria bacterium]